MRGIAQKKLKNLEFGLGQFDCNSIGGNALPVNVDCQSLVCDNALIAGRFLCGRCPTEDRLHTGNQFPDGERFGDVVISTDSKPVHFVIPAIATSILLPMEDTKDANSMLST